MTEELEKLSARGIVHAIRCQDDMQEASGAYKDIEEVIANELDLIKVNAPIACRGDKGIKRGYKPPSVVDKKHG